MVEVNGLGIEYVVLEEVVKLVDEDWPHLLADGEGDVTGTAKALLVVVHGDVHDVVAEDDHGDADGEEDGGHDEEEDYGAGQRGDRQPGLEDLLREVVEGRLLLLLGQHGGAGGLGGVGLSTEQLGLVGLHNVKYYKQEYQGPSDSKREPHQKAQFPI